MKNLFDIGLTDVKNVIMQKGYKFFTSVGVPNIIGIRKSGKGSNAYDDRCFVSWMEDDKEVVHTYTISTHPGEYYLKHPLAGTRGTAILVPNQYLNCWSLGMHRRVQFALCQRMGKVSVYRDDNMDTVLDLNPQTIEIGFFGIDLHHGSLGDADIVDKYSAGCQVWRYHEPHEDLMIDFKRLSTQYKFNQFTYTLLRQEDFI